MTRILVVDDRPEDRELTVLFLRHFGYEVAEASGPIEALDRLEQEEFDVVVSDILMPGMDGYEFAHTLRRDARFRALPVVFVSATYDDREMADLAQVYGGCRFVGKPMDPEELHRTVEEALRTPEAGGDFGSEAGQLQRLRMLSAKLLRAGESAKEAQAELERRGRQQEAIARLGDHALSSADVLETLEWGGWLVHEILHCDAVEIAVLAGFPPVPAGRLLLALSGTERQDLDPVLPGLAARLARLAAEGGSALVRAPLREPWLDPSNPASGGDGSAAFALVGPAERPAGLISAFTAGRSPLTEIDRSFVLGIAHVLGSAIARAGAEDESARLAALVHASEDAIVGCSQDGTITSWNPAAERLYGYAAAEAIGRPLAAVVAESDAPALEWVLGSLRRSEPVRALGMLHHARDGAVLEVELSASPVGDGAAAVVVRDIAERNRSERERLSLAEQLEHAQKLEALGRLAGGIAHDFNNLIMVIGGYSSLALDKLPPGDPVADAVDRIRLAADRASGLTRQLLAFGRRQAVQPRVIQLNEIVAEATLMLGRLLGEDIELVVTTDPELGLVRADPGQIEQVILNLAVNARDAMPQGGRLEIATAGVVLTEQEAERLAPAAAAGGYAQIVVADSGGGIDDETKARVFEPFFTTKPAGVGTGLGLATVHGIVTQSGGFVRLESEPGAGSAFAVYLPLTEAEAEPGLDAEAAPEERTSLHVLLVEDDPEVRDVVVELLESVGHSVAIADALEVDGRVGTEEPDVVLTDMVMPGRSGVELADAVHAVRPELPVLVMSGYSERWPASGAEDSRLAYIEKPFTAAELQEALRSVFAGTDAGKGG